MRTGGADLERDVRDAVRRALAAEVVRVEPLGAGLSFRRFARATLARGEPRTLVVRIDAPEDPAGRPAGLPPEPPLEPIRALLERKGLPVPRRLAALPGVELLEDFGDTTLERAAERADAAERSALYVEACAPIPRLQRIDDPGTGVEAFRRQLGAFLEYKAKHFLESSLPRGHGRASAEEPVRTAFAIVAEAVAHAPRRLAHRDLQSQNVLVRPGRPRGQRLGWIDLQGALLAPPEYDLVCLLRDSYVELPDGEVAALCERTRTALPDAPDPETFARRFDLLTLARKAKDHGRFLYAARERGDRRYLRYVPATVRALRTASARAARRDPGLRRFADLAAQLPESPCAP